MLPSKFSLAALIFAMAAFALAFSTDYASYLNARPPKSILQNATDAAKTAATGAAGAVQEKVKSWFDDAPIVAPSPAEPDREIDWNKRGIAVSVFLAVAAILLASVAFVRTEADHPRALISSRAQSVALALAGAALAYQFVLKGLIALAAGLLIAGVLGRHTRPGSKG
jgi:hypothetical protein